MSENGEVVAAKTDAAKSDSNKTQKGGLNASASEYKPTTWNVAAPAYVPKQPVQPAVQAAPVYAGAYDQNYYYQLQQQQQQQAYYSGGYYGAYPNNVAYSAPPPNVMYPNHYYQTGNYGMSQTAAVPNTEYTAPAAPAAAVTTTNSEPSSVNSIVDSSASVPAVAAPTAPAPAPIVEAPSGGVATPAAAVVTAPAPVATPAASVVAPTPAVSAPAEAPAAWKREFGKRETSAAATGGKEDWRQNAPKQEPEATKAAAGEKEDGWKRGVRLEPDVIKRSDGIHRYDKSLMLSFYCPGTYSIPAAVKKFYEKYVTSERISVGYEQNKRFNKGAAANTFGNSEVEEKDYKEEEALIFSEEKLKSTFHYDPSRLTVVAEGEKRDIEKEREVTINKANLTLNKLSVEKFEKLSDEFLQVAFIYMNAMQYFLLLC